LLTWVINQCNPTYRDWPAEKCERCEKLSLPCGPNISSKESRVNSAAHGSGTQEVSHEDDEYDLLLPDRQSFENPLEQVMGQAKLPSQYLHTISQPAGIEQSNTTSCAPSGAYPMRFLNLTPENNSDYSAIQSKMAISKANQRVEELQERSEPFPTSRILPCPDLKQASYA
jgi:hypothetical protein